jgi:primosomal protein N' (replication factor Y) (superfamily II helicase)
MLVDVALPVPRLAPLTYLLSTDQIGGRASMLGYRVLVHMGKRTITGTIVGMQNAQQPVPAGTRGVVEVLDDEPSCSASLLRLTRWIAEYYMCSWGEAIHATLPAGLTPEAVVRVTVDHPLQPSDMKTLERKAPKRAALLRLLQDHRDAVSVAWLEQQLRATSISEQLSALHRDGIVSITSDVEGSVGPKHQIGVVLSEFLVKDDDAIRAALDALDRRSPKQSAVLGFLYLAHHRGDGPTLRTRLIDELHTTSSVIEALVAKGYAELVPVEVNRESVYEMSLSQRTEGELVLTAEQQAAVDVISEATSAKAPSIFVIEGVTGSGKTVVYQRVIQKVISEGRGALVLVPEIALTPQLADRFRDVFGQHVAVLHSRMNPGERTDVWRAIRAGTKSIVLGPRSAVLAPIGNLGLIIVDEEHEPSYKQDDPAPRYHGRDVALMRGHIEECTVVLGSATLSLETARNIETGRYRRVMLTHRADGAVLPTIHVVDMRTARLEGATVGAYSTTLLDAIVERIRRKEGTLIFLNRRGYAKELQCHDCGDVPQCKNCDLSLTYHKATFTLRCHYCGHNEPARTMCHSCGGTNLKDVGTGTQRLEEDLAEVLRQRNVVATIARLDADSTARRGMHRKLLQRFADGDVDVLIGTQMIAKGLDISRVTLVGIISADQALYQSDFRASERTIQLLVQVAGRAGRTESRPGSVIVQTNTPSHPAIAAAVSNSLQEWRMQEMDQRKGPLYPPFARFIVLEVSALDEADVLHHAAILARLLPEDGQGLVRLEPVEPSVPRLRNRYRRVIIIKNDKAADPSGALCRSYIKAAMDEYYLNHASSKVRVRINVDASGYL